MAEITVSSLGDDRYAVSVRDERSETVHEVVATSSDLTYPDRIGEYLE